MTDQIIAFDRRGFALNELDGTVKRTTNLQREVRAERAELTVRASSANRSMLSFRNFVVVKSTIVPTWCGVIWDTREWADNNIKITLYSAEYVLGFRATKAVEKYDATASAIYTSLLKTAQADESLGILVSENYISATAVNMAKEFNREIIFRAINDVANEAEMYWWLAPVINSTTNRLVLRAYWQKQRGVAFPVPLVQGANFIDVKITEICNVANRIYAEGNFEDWNNPLEYIAEDVASQNIFGLVEDVVSDHDITDETALVNFGKAELTKRKDRRVKITGRVITSPYPSVGDSVLIHLSSDTSGFANGVAVIAPNILLRVKSIAYSPEEQGPVITADNLYWE